MEYKKNETAEQKNEAALCDGQPPKAQPEETAAQGTAPAEKRAPFLTKKRLIPILAAVAGIALILVLIVTVAIPLGRRMQTAGKIGQTVKAYQSGEMNFAAAEKQVREYCFVSAQSETAFRTYEKLCDAFFDQTVQDLKAGTISYEQAKKEFALLESSVIGDVAQAAKHGREKMIAEYAFEQSEKLAEEGEYQQAIALLAEVKEGNEAYEKAQQQKKGYLDQWAERISGQMDSLRASGDYEEALTQISDYRAFSADDRFDALAQTLSEEKLEYDKEHQLVTAEITSAEIDGWFVNECKYNLTNHSDRVLKKAEAVILIFDENGDPIDSVWGGYIKDENGKEIINAETDTVKEVALQPGETEEQRALTDNDAVKYKICVRSAEFEDGETWENPYFKVWLSEEKDRY